MKNSSNLNVSCKVVFSLNKWNKKVGSPSSFRRKRPFISLNSLASIENLSRSERARARARANHAINDAQKGCAMQLNGITLTDCLRVNLKNVDQPDFFFKFTASCIKVSFTMFAKSSLLLCYVAMLLPHYLKYQ